MALHSTWKLHLEVLFSVQPRKSRLSAPLALQPPELLLEWIYCAKSD